MNHVHDDQLLLLAYGELPDAEAAQAELHLAACAPCRARLASLERPRVALDWAAARAPRRPARWIAAGLAAAAVFAALLLTRTGPPHGAAAERVWPPPAAWSATAGYIAGGADVLQIDAQLTRLEQERYHALPD